MRIFGIVEETQGEDESIHFEVFDENWDSVLVFLSCCTCWRREIPAMSGTILYHGLRYTDVDIVIRSFGHRARRANEIFRDLQIMEMAALPILNKPK